MGENISHYIANAFPVPSKDTWSETAMRELDGGEPFTKLAWQDKDKNIFSPFYSNIDTALLPYRERFYLNPSKNSFAGNREWINKSLVSVANEVTANKQALDHLRNGADGILFDISVKREIDIEQLMQEIEWKYCSISFQGFDSKFIDSLKAFLAGNSHAPGNGNLFWENIPQSGITGSLLEFDTLKSLGCIVQSSTPVKEISDALIRGVKILEQYHGEEVKNIFPRISFSVPVSSDLLLSISKLKALRMLWYQIARAFGLSDFSPDDVHVHARSEKYVNEKFEPHGNILHSTIASMAAIFGGCDSLTVYLQEGENASLNRITRNVSSILREESHLNKVSDPVAGAYAIEVMADTLAREAWRNFQLTMEKR